ncbi:hypothetical protein BGZ94_007599 [Podila epigama]|nr:hypothetical protein BGZ94_007599 [Podila epigama]
MLFKKTSLFILATASVCMFMAGTAVQAAPTGDILEARDNNLLCHHCEEEPQCLLDCPNGYCKLHWCTCRPYCENAP